jgi:hypothetical protein
MIHLDNKKPIEIPLLEVLPPKEEIESVVNNLDKLVRDYLLCSNFNRIKYPGSSNTFLHLQPADYAINRCFCNRPMAQHIDKIVDGVVHEHIFYTYDNMRYLELLFDTNWEADSAKGLENMFRRAKATMLDFYGNYRYGNYFDDLLGADKDALEELRKNGFFVISYPISPSESCMVITVIDGREGRAVGAQYQTPEKAFKSARAKRLTKYIVNIVSYRQVVRALRWADMLAQEDDE